MIFRTEWIEGARFLSKMLYEHHNCSGETYTKPANIRKQNGPNYQKNILWSDFSWTINNLGKPNILIPTAYLSCVNWSLSMGSLPCNCNKKKIYKCNPRLSRLIISQVWVVNIVWSLFAIMPFHTFLVDCIYLLDCEFSDTGYDITDLGIYAASMPLFEFMGKICRITYIPASTNPATYFYTCLYQPSHLFIYLPVPAQPSIYIPASTSPATYLYTCLYPSVAGLTLITRSC